jgi:four helix bundle protein
LIQGKSKKAKGKSEGSRTTARHKREDLQFCSGNRSFLPRLDSKPRSLRILAQQLVRSGTSVGANVQEAQAGQSRADFISKYSIALKEARETLYWLRLLDSSGEPSNGACKILLREADEIARVIASIIVNTKKGGRS